jgi:hypothetical protein
MSENETENENESESCRGVGEKRRQGNNEMMREGVCVGVCVKEEKRRRRRGQGRALNIRAWRPQAPISEISNTSVVTTALPCDVMGWHVVYLSVIEEVSPRTSVQCSLAPWTAHFPVYSGQRGQAK